VEVEEEAAEEGASEEKSPKK